jgi:DNA-binding MarR family transcriptional regulator
MLPIRQHLLMLTCLKSNAKMVLVEVCELAENGKKGGCFASNTTLARDLGISLATVTRTVASLVAAGLLTSDVVKAEANRRYLRPTARLRACYTGGSEAQQLAAIAELTIVKNDTDYSQNEQVTIVKTGADYSQNASRVLGDDQYDQVDDQEALLTQEREAFQKKIGELENENARLRHLLAQSQASHTRGAAGGYREFEAEWPAQLHPPFKTPAFREAWAKFAGYLAELGKPFRGHQHEDAALQKLRRLVGTDHTLALKALTDTMANGWHNLNLDNSKAARPETGAPGQAEERLSTIDETLQARRERRAAA